MNTNYNSNTIRCYKHWLFAVRDSDSVAFVDSVYAFCEEHYSQGGDEIVECFTPTEILKEFDTLNDVKAFIRIRLDNALNCRYGSDDDPELKRSQDFPF